MWQSIDKLPLEDNLPLSISQHSSPLFPVVVVLALILQPVAKLINALAVFHAIFEHPLVDPLRLSQGAGFMELAFVVELAVVGVLPLVVVLLPVQYSAEFVAFEVDAFVAMGGTCLLSFPVEVVGLEGSLVGEIG